MKTRENWTEHSVVSTTAWTLVLIDKMAKSTFFSDICVGVAISRADVLRRVG